MFTIGPEIKSQDHYSCRFHSSDYNGVLILMGSNSSGVTVIIIDIRTHINSFQFFSLLDDRDLDVRTVAEESINRVINALRDSHSGRLQVKARHKIARDAQN